MSVYASATLLSLAALAIWEGNQVPVSVNANAIFAMRKVGEELARLREQAGLRQDDIAVRLNCSRHNISKIERGKAYPSPEQLEEMLTTYGASVEQRAAVVAAIDQGKSFGRAWYERPQVQALFTGDSYRYLSLEDAAEHLSMHSATYVPGLLQTREYIEAIVTFGQKHESAERREAFVETRLRRQAVLTRRYPLTLDALCLESALRAIVGGPKVMRAQLRHLLESTKQQNINLRVIPFAAGAASISSVPFTIIDFPGADNRSVVSQERVRGETLQDDSAEVRRTRRKFADLTDHVLDEEESIRLIEEIEKELP
ncbi:helix-turn-helix domain-containing protein [Streptomyces sp. NPDC051569]|uniref:helix-turn-helix domain-containing protein n=1 Tax=Streptomyces sp. NPDC051569 TaxID=3365661 RepID=UPI0037B473B9